PVEDWPEVPADGANVRGQVSGNLPAAEERRVVPPIPRPTLSRLSDGAGNGAASATRRRSYTYHNDSRYYSYRRWDRGYHRQGRGYYGSVYGRVCDPEILGHITRWTCAYRYR